MRRIVAEPWTSNDIETLKAFIIRGASPLRSAVALKRSTDSIRTKARELGTPFPSQVD